MRKLVALIGSAGLLVSSTYGVAAKETLRVTLQLPLKSSLGQNVAAFKKEVEAASKGDLEIQIYDSAQLYKDKEVPQAVGSGAIEMGVASLTRFAGDVPAVDVMYVPFLFNTNEDLAALAENSINFYLALRRAGVPAELHIYERGIHGGGLNTQDAVLSTWADRLTDWLRGRGLTAS